MNESGTQTMKTRFALLTFTILGMIALVLSGCGESTAKNNTPGSAWRLSRAVPEKQYRPSAPMKLTGSVDFSAGKSVQGRDIACRVFGDSGDTVMIIGGIHGNEPASVVLARQLGEYLTKNPHIYRDVRVVLVENVNPDGIASNTRTNARGVDLNRNFPAWNRDNNSRNGYQALSEPESRIIERLVNRYNPSRVVALHQPYGCIDYDGPGRHLAEQMAAHSPLPVRKLGARPGSMGSWLGETKQVSMITMELPGEVENRPDRLWPAYGPSLLTSIRYGK